MKFTQLPAPEHLRNIVRYCWTLESGDDSAASGSRTFRTMGPWNNLNTIRTLASTLSIVLVIIACLYPADPPGK
jgi:hypothetical protein